MILHNFYKTFDNTHSFLPLTPYVGFHPPKLFLIFLFCTFFFESIDRLITQYPVFFPQKNPIVEGLRAIFGGGNSPNFKFLDGISIPASMIPPEFKFIKNGLCGSGARTRMCFCEENANIEKIVFPRNKNSVTFKDLKRIFAQCRPT